MPKHTQSDIRRRIEASGDPQTLDQLCLDGIPIETLTPAIKRLIEGCTSLQYLTMNNCELQSLENFPHLRRLIGLELANNEIHEDDLPRLAAVPQVNFLALGDNRIAAPAGLRHLQCLPELEILQLQENQCCQEENYREAVFTALPGVKVVDRLDRTGRETEEQNPSEYLSHLGNSRLDLLELLDQEEGEEKGDQKEEFLRTATSYVDAPTRERKNSLEQAMAANPSHFSVFLPHAHRSSTPQKGFHFMRAEPATNSDSDSQDGLIKSFKKKFHKKQ